LPKLKDWDKYLSTILAGCPPTFLIPAKYDCLRPKSKEGFFTQIARGFYDYFVTGIRNFKPETHIPGLTFPCPTDDGKFCSVKNGNNVLNTKWRK